MGVMRVLLLGLKYLTSDVVEIRNIGLALNSTASFSIFRIIIDVSLTEVIWPLSEITRRIKGVRQMLMWMELGGKSKEGLLIHYAEILLVELMVCRF
jgi:hypothetical protein